MKQVYKPESPFLGDMIEQTVELPNNEAIENKQFLRAQIGRDPIN